MEAIPGFRWCIAKDCKSGQVHDEGDITPKVRCVGCKKTHCMVHQIAWHKGETCAQYDYRYVSSCPTVRGKDGGVLADSGDRANNKIKKAEESASIKLIKELAKQCPECKWNIEKNDGCDHMTCKNPSLSFVICTRKGSELTLMTVQVRCVDTSSAGCV